MARNKKAVGIFKKWRLKIKNGFDDINNENVKQNVLQAIPFWIGSLVTGIMAVLYAKVFLWVEDGTAYIYNHTSWVFFLISPVCFIISWWLVKRFAPYSRGSGIPQVMAAIELSTPKYNDKVKQLLSIPIIIVKVISSLVLAIGGGIIGREGPTIQIAGSVFRKINEWLPAWWPKVSKRNMIMTGAAAGLAAAFNTPLGGIVFAVEELTKTHISYFKTALFTAVIVAGLTAQALLGPYLYLGYPNVNNLSWWIFAGVLLVAVVAGLCGSFMCKMILWIFKWKSKFNTSKHVAFLVGIGLIVALSVYFFGLNTIGSGKDIMTDTLFTSEKYLPWYMPLFRIMGSLLSFTSGAAGGLFAPALSAGASIGATIAGWLQISDTNSNLLIMCGMVAFLTGVTRSPFTSAILVLEMTDGNNVIFHLMLAGMAASVVSLLVDKHSLYDRLKHQYMHELTDEHIDIDDRNDVAETTEEDEESINEEDDENNMARTSAIGSKPGE